MKLLLTVLLCLTCLNIMATELDVTIISSDNSLRDEPKDNIEQYLAQLEIKPTDSNDFIRQQVVKQSQLAMQAVGYYRGVAKATIDKRSEKAVDVSLDIILGKATLIAQSDFSVRGAGKADPDFDYLTRIFPLVFGSKFHHGRFEDNKTAFNQLAQEKGYFDAHWSTSAVEVDLDDNRARIIQIFDTGLRYRFGQTVLPKNHPASALVDAMLPYATNQFYDADLLAKFNLALHRSAYFSSAQAIPMKPNPGTGLVDISLLIVDKPKNMVELAAGYSRDTSLRASVQWTKPWINRHGHSLVTNLNVSALDKLFSVQYKIPHGDPNTDFTSLVVSWQDQKLVEQDYEKYSLAWQRHQPISDDWQRILFLKYEHEFDRLTQSTSNLVIPGVSYSRIRRRGGLSTYWGDRQLLSVEVANKLWGSSNNIAKVSLHSNWLRQLNDTHQILFKLQLGAISADDITDVPTSLRFFSGGDDNLRAYGYRSVAPLDTSLSTTLARGGLYQALATFEYSYPVAQNWRIATFYDVGTTTDDFSESLKSDTGIGLRWKTPVGPIRLDFAWGLQKDLHPAFDYPSRISLTIGVNL